ncbi:hypothetical protein EDB81DRAFT_797886 [Dactylonectria macrodidyma]|uniref:Uncharacterized protein n=1 Tax=Dactylonectria macrodidyma TaxID=307937 RepID=A0A9P9EMB3_9HYPO|nr:hypothetical protein EDB81DRAFT_797886 [Dactylonectria macrodidyma]
MGQAESKAASSTPTLPPEIKKLGFPQKFIVSYRGSWTGSPSLLLSKPYSSPSFIVSMARGRFGDMVLHSGPTKNDTPLANAKPKKRRQSYTITLPSSDGGGREELLQLKRTILKDKFEFSMEVGDGTDGRVERFEWKTRGFGGWLGWKLVRVRQTNENPNKVIQEDPEKAVANGDDPEKIEANDREGEDDIVRDGEEIVAVWVDAKMSLYKVGEFEFRGAGATGQFGQVWSLMAVMTCLSIWQKYEHEAFTTAMLANDSHSHSDPHSQSDPHSYSQSESHSHHHTHHHTHHHSEPDHSDHHHHSDSHHHT